MNFTGSIFTTNKLWYHSIFCFYRLLFEQWSSLLIDAQHKYHQFYLPNKLNETIINSKLDIVPMCCLAYFFFSLIKWFFPAKFSLLKNIKIKRAVSHADKVNIWHLSISCKCLILKFGNSYEVFSYLFNITHASQYLNNWFFLFYHFDIEA